MEHRLVRDRPPKDGAPVGEASERHTVEPGGPPVVQVPGEPQLVDHGGARPVAHAAPTATSAGASAVARAEVHSEIPRATIAMPWGRARSR